jgi:hypothetical protein
MIQNDNEPRSDEGHRFRHRKPAREGLCPQPYQHGKDDGADRYQDDAEQIPDQERQNRYGDDDRRLFEKIEVGLLHNTAVRAAGRGGRRLHGTHYSVIVVAPT